MTSKIKPLLSLFGLKDIEMEIFEKIFSNGFINAADLARQSNITRTSVYDYLERLRQKGLIIQTFRGGVRMYSVELPEKLQLLLEEQENNIAAARESLVTLKENYGKKHTNLRPRIQLFEGREELQQMMKDLLLYQDITVRVYWPILDIIKLLTPSFLNEFNKKRIASNIILKTIWPRTQVPSLKQYPFLKISNKEKREVRLAPEKIDFSLGYAIYENTVRFISSSKESFGFLITSKELANTMQGQFDIVWEKSKPFIF
jgi:sugar-specific transcriptional regulator TrmB